MDERTRHPPLARHSLRLSPCVVVGRLHCFQRGEAVRRTGGGVSDLNLKKSFQIFLVNLGAR